MDNVLSIPENPLAARSEETFLALAKAGDWLPRMQLFTANTKEVKADKVQMNQYGIVIAKDVIREVGKEVNVCPIEWRPCAIRIGSDAVDNVFDPNGAEFKAIMAESELEDSGCFFGLQFLLWVPSQKMFVTFLFGSKSARPEAGNMKPLIGKVATMKSRLAESKKFQWQVPVVIESSEPPSSVPDQTKLLEEIEKFRNPPVKVREKAEPVAGSTGREQ